MPQVIDGDLTKAVVLQRRRGPVGTLPQDYEVLVDGHPIPHLVAEKFDDQRDGRTWKLRAGQTEARGCEDGELDRFMPLLAEVVRLMRTPHPRGASPDDRRTVGFLERQWPD